MKLNDCNIKKKATMAIQGWACILQIVVYNIITLVSFFLLRLYTFLDSKPCSKAKKEDKKNWTETN